MGKHVRQHFAVAVEFVCFLQVVLAESLHVRETNRYR
jgi:hypothetical protein